MENDRVAIQTKLETVADAVYQSMPEQMEVIPCVTWRMGNNVPVYLLDKTISHQDHEIVLDIWANNDTEAEALLASVTDALLDLNYRLTFNSDVPNPDSSIFHITTQFVQSI